MYLPQKLVSEVSCIHVSNSFRKNGGKKHGLMTSLCDFLWLTGLYTKLISEILYRRFKICHSTHNNFHNGHRAANKFNVCTIKHPYDTFVWMLLLTMALSNLLYNCLVYNVSDLMLRLLYHIETICWISNISCVFSRLVFFWFFFIYIHINTIKS